MKITNEKIVLSPSEEILWGDVKTMRLLNEKLALVLTNDRIIELDHLHSSTINLAFRYYESYLKDHPEKRTR